MTFAERLFRWNSWYDGAPAEWRFQIVFWFVIAAGALNMALTIADGFPFGLLVLVAIAGVAGIRAPHTLGWLKGVDGRAGAAGSPRLEIETPEWVYRLNLWYDAIPEFKKPFYLLGALIVFGAVNMALTIAHAFTFGLLFLIGLVALITIRGPYVAGWYKVPATLRPRIAVTAKAPPLIPPGPGMGQPVVMPAAAAGYARNKTKR